MSDSLSTSPGFREVGETLCSAPAPGGWGAILVGASSDGGGGGGSGEGGSHGGHKESCPPTLSPRGGVWPQFHAREAALLKHGGGGRGEEGCRLCFHP